MNLIRAKQALSHTVVAIVVALVCTLVFSIAQNDVSAEEADATKEMQNLPDECAQVLVGKNYIGFCTFKYNDGTRCMSMLEPSSNGSAVAMSCVSTTSNSGSPGGGGNPSKKTIPNPPGGVEVEITFLS